MPVTGNATTSAGNAVDYVRFFRWPSGTLAGVAVPDQNGGWEKEIYESGNYGITYIADGCQPVTHGPYYFEASSDPYWDSVVCLMHFDEDITDVTGKTWTISGSAPFVAGKYGDALKTTNGHLRAASSAWNDLSYSEGDFTVELFMKAESVSSRSAIISHEYTGSSSRMPIVIGIGGVGGTSGENLWFGLYSGSWKGEETSFSPVLGRWYHVAATREGDTYRLFIDGTIVGHFISNAVAIPANDFLIGRRWDTAHNPNFDGVIDELRITKGVARYTEGFSPPEAPHISVGA